VKIDIVTIFPSMVRGSLAEGVVGRAAARGMLDIRVHDLRDHTTDRHRVVDDQPFGGGPGMVLKPEPLFTAVEHIRADRGTPAAVILTSPDGRRFTYADAARLSGLGHIVLLCGRYEGVDERVRAHLATEALSIGDYVLTGGELPAVVVIDAVIRLLPGAIDAASTTEESVADGLHEYPQYTRPPSFRGRDVPAILAGGDHGAVRTWRLRESLRRTLDRRPDLLSGRDLSGEESALLDELRGSDEGSA
jgi:tRNA (guanine37-N1)-methyltransferase